MLDTLNHDWTRLLRNVDQSLDAQQVGPAQGCQHLDAALEYRALERTVEPQGKCRNVVGMVMTAVRLLRRTQPAIDRLRLHARAIQPHRKHEVRLDRACHRGPQARGWIEPLEFL